MTRRAIERRFFISKKALSKFTRDIAGAPLLVWFTGIQLPTVPTLLRSQLKERGTSSLSPCLFVSSRLKCISFLFFYISVTNNTKRNFTSTAPAKNVTFGRRPVWKERRRPAPSVAWWRKRAHDGRKAHRLGLVVGWFALQAWGLPVQFGCVDRSNPRRLELAFARPQSALLSSDAAKQSICG